MKIRITPSMQARISLLRLSFNLIVEGPHQYGLSLQVMYETP